MNTKNDKKITKHNLIRAVLVCFASLSVFSCVDNNDNAKSGVRIKPEGQNPAWAPNIDPEMLAVIEQLDKLNPTPLTEKSVEAARNSPTPKDAVQALMTKYNITPVPPKVTMTERMIKGPATDSLQVRIYTPQTNKTSYPVIVYYHGGGWVIANPEVYEASTQGLSEKAEAIVVSVNYRKAPENKFPAAHEDAYAAYQWARMNSHTIKGDTTKVAVAGESAGGNLAASVCLMARSQGFPMPVHQLLVYPIANYNFESPSYQQYANAKPLSKPLMQWFFMHYLNSPAEGNNPLISLLNAEATGLPSATVLTAEIDPLLSEGKAYADKLSAAGVDVSYRNYEGVTHEFFGMAAVLPDAMDAQEFASGKLKETFNKIQN